MGRDSRAWGICQRSGKRILLKDLVQDGYIPGMLVQSSWHEPRNNDLQRPNLFDRVNLTRPSPDNNQENHTVMFPCFSFTTFETIPPLVLNMTLKTTIVRII